MTAILSHRAPKLPILLVCSLCLAMFRFFLAPKPTLNLSENHCWSGQNSTTALQRLDDLQVSYDLKDFLEGPGLMDSDNRSACKFIVDDHTPHFPHAMQQLYRCFAWWNANPHKDPYLVMYRQPLDNEFLKGMIARLRDVFGVRVVNFRHNLKVVRSIFSYDWDERHSFAFRSRQDSYALRDGILQHYRIAQHNNHTFCSDPVRVGILDRKKSRSLQNRGAIVKAIERALQRSVKFRVIDFEDRSFYEQVEFLANTDILISPHGAQLTGLPFLPNCASVLELFPGGYQVPYFYGSLAAVSGVAHSFIYLGRDSKSESNIAMKDLSTRNAARSANLCPNVDALAHAVLNLVQERKQCCQLKRWA